MLNVEWTLISQKGFLAEGKFRVHVVSKIMEELMKQLDKLPDEIEGVRVWDWSTLKIEVRK